MLSYNVKLVFDSLIIYPVENQRFLFGVYLHLDAKGHCLGNLSKIRRRWRVKNINLKVKTGEHILGVQVRAAKISLLNNAIVHFVFNGKRHEMTPAKAQKIISPRRIKKEINNLKERIKELELDIQEEEKFLKKLIDKKRKTMQSSEPRELIGYDTPYF